jgi:prepilin signal peptidase PulO-like enzyme (type II secretory pathway)
LPRARLAPVLALASAWRTCPRCGWRASWRAPLLGIALALLFPLLLARVRAHGQTLRIAPAGVLAIDLLGCCLLALIVAIDLEHRLILDSTVFPALVALVGVAAIWDHKALAAMLFGVVIYGGLFALLYCLGLLTFRTEALGLGDVKLALLIGVLVGWPGIVLALVVGALAGGAASVVLLGLGRAGPRTFIPYGIYLVLGAALALLLTPPIW